MALIAMPTDTHAGVRNDNPAFQLYQKKCWQWFFDYIDANNIKHVIHLGDIYDRRRYINFMSAKRLREDFFEPLEERGIETHIIQGNHDSYYKDTHEVNALDEVVSGRYRCIRTHSTPSVISIDGLSGHYHHRSTIGNITYIGAFGEYTWHDYSDPRGFSVLDTESKVLDFIQNPYKMFRIAKYDDVANPDIVEKIQRTDFSKYKDTYVKLVVVNKSNPYAFDLLFDSIYKVGPLDIQVIEDPTVLLENEDADEIDEAEDTVTILRKYIDGLTLPINNNRMKSFMIDIYNEALQVETV